MHESPQDHSGQADITLNPALVEMFIDEIDDLNGIQSPGDDKESEALRRGLD
jgi:hypothetical protein